MLSVSEMRCETDGADVYPENKDTEKDQEKRRIPWDAEAGAEEIEYFTDDMQEAIRQCVHNIIYRKILEWRELDGLSYSKIREKLNKELGTDRTERQIGYIINKHVRRLVWYCRKISS